MTKYNLWFFSSLIIALIVSLPILTVFFSFFQETSNYFSILKNTFLFDYIFNSLTKNGFRVELRDNKTFFISWDKKDISSSASLYIKKLDDFLKSLSMQISFTIALEADDEILLNGNDLTYDGNSTRLLPGSAPGTIPWDAFDVDIVIDSTGVYRKKEQLQFMVKSILTKISQFQLAISVTTRTPRHGEIEAVDYYFMQDYKLYKWGSWDLWLEYYTHLVDL